MRRFLIACALVPLAGCAAAQMQLPANLATSERTEFQGIGGGSRGHYTAGGYAGDFERSSERLSYFDTLNEARGGSRFTLAGAVSAPVEGRCRMRERSVDLGWFEVTTRPMAYRCEFARGGRPLDAWLELQEQNGPGTAINRYERRGAIAFGDDLVEIRSVHHIAGTPLPTSTPIGYVFELDGHPVGAVELNGSPVLTVEPGTAPELRETLTLAALALGVFWDPASEV